MKSLVHALLLLAGLLPAGEKLASDRPHTAVLSFTAPKAAPGDARVEVRLYSERDPSVEPISLGSLAIGQLHRVELPDRDGAWAVDVVSDPFWHGRQYIVPSDTAIALELREKAFVIGRLKVDAALPKELSLVLTEQHEETRIEHTTDCAVDQSEADFRCEVPAGNYDLRLTADGFIATSWLGVAIPAGARKNLQVVDLKRGQAIVARVTVPKGVDLESTRVHVERRSGVRFLSAPPNARGTVQLSGVPPGAYVVTATHPDGLSSERVDVVVRDGTETVVPETLALSRPRTLEAHISPPLSPTFDPWIIELTRERGAAGQVETVASSRATDVGEWRSKELQPDRYVLSVASKNGDVWHRETVELHAVDESRTIAIQTRRAHGKLRLGQNPVAALLTFTFASSLRSVSTTSNREGEFQITLPDTKTTVWDVTVSVPDLRVKRVVKVTLPDDEAEALAIDLPAWTLTGVVLDAAGAPASGAIVHVAGETAMPFTQTLSEEDGAFMIAAVPNGTYSLQASAASGESEVTDVAVSDADAPPVELTLTGARELRGRIVSVAGPVVGARVQVVPRGMWVPTVYTYTTREDGRFGAKLPPRVDNVDLLIAPPGFAFTAANVPYRSEVLTVQVPQAGGTLELIGGSDDDGAQLFHDGAILFLNGPLSYEWPSRRESGKFVAPQMEPGLYRYCASGKCAEGFLASNSTLRLTLR